MKPVKMLVGAIVSLFSCTAFTVEYTFPENDSWYQLQDIFSYETLCDSDTPRCDIPSGVYKLLEFSEGSVDIVQVTVNPPESAPRKPIRTGESHCTNTTRCVLATGSADPTFIGAFCRAVDVATGKIVPSAIGNTIDSAYFGSWGAIHCLTNTEADVTLNATYFEGTEPLPEPPCKLADQTQC